MMIKAIIFDFDGTLTPLSLDFAFLKGEIANIARRYTTEEIIKKIESNFIIEMIRKIEERLDGTSAAEEFQKKAFDRLKFLELESAMNKDVYPYTRDVLKNLKVKGVKTGIITRTCIDVVRRVFVDIDNYIDVTVTREDTKHVKPDPIHAFAALRMLGVLPDESMMVGDHPTDVMAGIGAGMMTVGVLTGRTQREDFEEIGATFIMDDIRDILNLEVIKS
ncbi:MAG: HAD-IA family hydrolase [Proteobacteria bacterium]|nr:HAD-IA family hydrolase [Pseudomonadota bacterium]